jgi:hypothetical protein
LRFLPAIFGLVGKVDSEANDAPVAVARPLAKVELVIYLKTAKALGPDAPPTLFATRP